MATTSRRPSIAFLLSLLTPGLGQAYCGRRLAGLLFYAPLLILAFLYRLAPRLGWDDEAAVIIVGAALVLVLASALEAANGARQLAEDDRTGPSRWYVHLSAMLVTAALVFCIASLGSYSVPSASMDPTVIAGDEILTTAYGFPLTRPARCDVAVFIRELGEKPVAYIKRVIALAGDRVAYRNGRLVINGTPVVREKVGQDERGTIYRETLPAGCSYLILEHSDSGPLDNTAEVTVAPGTAFVLGDNRDDSMDSRIESFGPVALEKFRSKVFFLHNPAKPDRTGWVQ